MAHIVVPEAEALLDQPIAVLDKGFVRLVDYLGGDARIVAAARVSYGAGTKTAREDRALIHYLFRNAHTSPFEQVQLTFHCKLPIFVARQWIRHRTARLNELSGRYSVMRDEFYVPDGARVALQSEENKQGSGDSVTPQYAARVLELLKAEQAALYTDYSGMVEAGVARELARINLPLSLYTEWYWQIDLHNLFHFLRLRLDPHAQYEIRQYAAALAQCAQAVAPLAYEAFEEYELYGARFSKTELRLIRDMLKNAGISPESDLGALSKLPAKRREEFARKLWGAGPAAGGIEVPDFKPAQRDEPPAPAD
jgi:thymidylate synthase (FAD)